MLWFSLWHRLSVFTSPLGLSQSVPVWGGLPFLPAGVPSAVRSRRERGVLLLTQLGEGRLSPEDTGLSGCSVQYYLLLPGQVQSSRPAVELLPQQPGSVRGPGSASQWSWSGSEGKCDLYPSGAILSPPQIGTVWCWEKHCLPLGSVLGVVTTHLLPWLFRVRFPGVPGQRSLLRSLLCHLELCGLTS